MCPCICWYINTYKITELFLARMKFFYYNNCGGINYWRKKSIFCCQIWPLHPNFSFCIPDGCVNPYQISYNTEILYCKFSLRDTAWTIDDVFVDPHLFCFGQSIPFQCSKNGMDRPKQKRVWIDQDVIDGPHCIVYMYTVLGQ